MLLVTNSETFWKLNPNKRNNAQKGCWGDPSVFCKIWASWGQQVSYSGNMCIVHKNRIDSKDTQASHEKSHEQSKSGISVKLKYFREHLKKSYWLNSQKSGIGNRTYNGKFKVAGVQRKYLVIGQTMNRRSRHESNQLHLTNSLQGKTSSKNDTG